MSLTGSIRESVSVWVGGERASRSFVVYTQHRKRSNDQILVHRIKLQAYETPIGIFFLARIVFRKLVPGNQYLLTGKQPFLPLVLSRTHHIAG